MALLFAILTMNPAHAYEVGTAPFCVMDNYGNTECYYYDLSSCIQAARNHYGTATCIHR